MSWSGFVGEPPEADHPGWPPYLPPIVGFPDGTIGPCGRCGQHGHTDAECPDLPAGPGGLDPRSGYHRCLDPTNPWCEGECGG